MEEETKYIIKTNDKREMLLMLNATRMAQALYDIISWNRAIYNGKDYDGHVYFKGKFYSKNEWYSMNDKDISEEDRNEQGFIKKDLLKYVYLNEDIEYKLNDILRDVNDFIYNYYE